MKKLLLLGGSRYLLPVIKTAHDLGIYVITCDYLPDNEAHKYSDQYFNISIIEKEKILEVSLKNNINGIMSFACDPGVITAAYVAEKMGLPFQCSYETAIILQDKGFFRKFLADNGFNVPHVKRYTDGQEAFKDIKFFTWPVIVKPVDSAGSKGVSRVDFPEDLGKAIKMAIEVSHSRAFIIEDFLTFDGYHSSADSFIVDGKLKFITYSDQLFDKDADNPYTPAYIIWPSSMKKHHQKTLSDEIQRLVKLLGLRTGIYNIETWVCTNGKAYIMEVSPRGGGCKIAELQKMAFGIDLIENEVRKAIGTPVKDINQGECTGDWCEMVVHAMPGHSGILKSIIIEPEIREKYVKVMDISVKEGDFIRPFTGANMSMGDMFLKFNSRKELNDVIFKSNEWLHIELE